MAVKIRLKRVGKKKQPYYRVVVADARFPREERHAAAGRIAQHYADQGPGVRR